MLYKDYFVDDPRIPVEFRLRKDGRLHERVSGVTFSFEESVIMSKERPGLNEIFKELYADKIKDLFPMPPKFKAGDKVIVINDDSITKKGWIGVTTPDKNDTTDYITVSYSKDLYKYETMPTKIKDLELYIEPEKKKEIVDLGWGFE